MSATYDPKKVLVTFGSAETAITLSDFGPDSMVKVSRQGEDFEVNQGAGGYTEWTNKNIAIHTIEVTLMQTSPTNDFLSKALSADRSGNAGQRSFTVRDNSTGGTTVIVLTGVRIVKSPEVSFGATGKELTWTFKASGIGDSYLIGGSTGIATPA
jgi:hypothetical protein